MLPLLLAIIVLPLAFIVPLFILRGDDSFTVALVSSFAVFAISIAASYLGLSQGFSSLSFGAQYIPALGVGLDLALTQYTSILLLMSSVVILAAAIVAKGFIKESARIYNLLFLLISSSTLGLFLAANFFLFYVFWEIAEISMFFIIYIFGGYDRRYAAMKFLIYSLIASLFLLLGIVMIYTYLPSHALAIQTVISQGSSLPNWVQVAVTLLLLVAFMIKMPVFPFHTWLPDAHTEAPTTGSMMLAGILLKFGGYGFLLLSLTIPLVSAYAKYLALLFVVSALYSALAAMRQANFKRLIAYTSIVDMGIVALGVSSLNALGQAGAVYAMLSHGIVISMLFLLAGILDESFGTMLMERIRGVVKTLPGLAYSFLFGVFAFAGIPLTAGFVGELLIFIGAYKSFGIVGLVPLAAVFVVAAFLFFVAERVFMNSSSAEEPIFNPRKSDYYAVAFLAAASVVFGVVPFLLLSPFA